MEQEYWNQLSGEDIEDIGIINETIEAYYQGVETLTDVVEPQNIFFVIGHKVNFYKTIENSVDINEKEDIILEADYKNLKSIYPSEKMNCWGFKDNLSKDRWWENMEPGDLCLMYYNNKIVMSGIITYTLYNKKLAEEIWVNEGVPF